MVFQFHGALHPAQDLAAAQHVLRHALLRVYVHIVAGAQHAVLHGAVLFQRLKARRAPRADKVVRVHARGIVDDARAQARGFEDVQRPQRRLLPGGVAIVADPHLGGIALHQARLFLGQRRAQRGDHALHAVLAQGDGVHVALHQHQMAAGALLLGEVEGVEALPLVEHRRIGGVEVLGLRVAQRPAAETQHLALRADDGKDGPAAKHVVNAALAAHDEAGALQRLFVKALPGQVFEGGVPAAGGEAEAEMADIRVGKAAFIEVGKRLRALPRPQCGVKKTRRRDVGLVDALALVRADGVCPRRALRQRQMRALRQQLDGLRKVQPLHLHHELYDRAALVTAEAVEELRFRIHGKGWCFFIVERTQAPAAAALALERNVFGNDLLNADARTQFVQPCV